MVKALRWREPVASVHLLAKTNANIPKAWNAAV
jgi:hypothetical protein